MKPITFPTPMVRAILAGKKTETRRVINPQPVWEERGPEYAACSGWFWKHKGETWQARPNSEEFAAAIKQRAPYQSGDILWVRETWGTITKGIGFNAYEEYVHKAGSDVEGIRWCSPRYMPKAAARLFLRVTGVQAQCLHDGFTEPISPIFALRDEGIDIGEQCECCIDSYGSPCCVDTVDEDGTNLYGGECGVLDEIRSDYAKLWDDLNAKRGHSWSSNPWVWVYTFEPCEKPEEGSKDG